MRIRYTFNVTYFYSKKPLPPLSQLQQITTLPKGVQRNVFKRIHTYLIDKNGYILEKDEHAFQSDREFFSKMDIFGPDELKTSLWINPNEINIGDIIKNEDSPGGLVVESTKIFGGRNCFCLKKSDEYYVTSVFYDKSTGLYMGSIGKSSLDEFKTQLTSTNARILNNILQFK